LVSAFIASLAAFGSTFIADAVFAAAFGSTFIADSAFAAFAGSAALAAAGALVAPRDGDLALELRELAFLDALDRHDVLGRLERPFSLR
jgi:hypothetical protein